MFMNFHEEFLHSKFSRCQLNLNSRKILAKGSHIKAHGP